MIPKLVWCLFVLFFINKNYCSPTERDLYAFTTLANAEEQSTIEDTELAETNIHPDSYGDATELSTQNANLEDSEEEDPRGPDDHVIPYSEHENPEEPPTRPDYVAPGVWAKPDPKKNIPLNFVPTKSLAQVRGTHTVKILPQSEAVAAATSDEEKLNAPRLREVVSKKKTNTIYTEEGYEDSAYDHAGHIRDADFHEGYARKLHDQRQSEARSGAGRKRKSKKKKSRNKAAKKPEEFEEFTDDYSDEGTPTERYQTDGSTQKSEKKKANTIYKDMWKRPDVNPKIVAENEIEKLEHDLKREDEQAERGSENYAGVTESQGGSDEDHSRDGWSASESRRSKNRSKNPSRTKERIFKENYEATTVEFETPTPGGPVQYEAATSGYENPTTNAYYIPEGSAVQQNYEVTTFANGDSNDPHPTTVNYGDIFWKYFKSIPNEAVTPVAFLQDQTTIQQPFLGGEVTTLDPFVEQPSPVAVATINGHGPYLLVSENGGGTQSPYHSSIQSDFQVRNGHQQITPDVNFNEQYGQRANSRGGLNFPDFVHSNGPVTGAYDSWGFNKGGYNPQELPFISTDSPTTGFYDSLAFSSTPTYSVIKSPLKEFNDQARKTTARIDSRYKNNPFFNSAEDGKQNQGDQVDDKFGSFFKGWSTNNKQKSAAKDSGEEDSSESKKKGVNFFGYNPDLKYKKMLGFIKSQKNGRYDGQKSESSEFEDFTIMKPPALRESVFSDFTLNSYPNVADYSSASQESESSQEQDGKKFNDRKNGTKHNGLLQKDTNHKSPSFHIDRPAVGRKRLFPASKLLPPEPNSKDDYAEHSYLNRKNGYYKSSKHPNPRYNPNFGNGVQNYNPDPEQLARYLRNRKSPKRQTRSLDEIAIREEKIADAVIAQEINARFNFTFEDQGSTRERNAGELRNEKSRVKRNLISIKQNKSATEDLLLPIEKGQKNGSIRDKRSHQDLLDASHKITDDVINDEINSRFKNKVRDLDQEDDREDDDREDHESEDLEEEEPEKRVEIEEPDLDYLDDVQEANNIDRLPTTKTPAIDVLKYPFYMNRRVSDSSPLKYIINPEEVPKKTLGGMEFYDSRDKYVQCEEVDPNLEEVVPDDEEPVPNRGPKENLPRLRGLGDKLDCFKAKYFGENPFDSPLFFEKQINQPTPPTELDPIKFATRILELPEESMNYYVPSQSRKPEAASIKRIDYGRRNKNRQNNAEASNLMAAILPRTRKRNSTNHTELKVSSTEKPRIESQRTRRRRPGRKPQTTTTEAPEINPVTPYQKEVYDDVMGTIKNLASMYEMFESHTSSPVADVTIAPPYAGRVPNPSNTRNDKTPNRFPTLKRQRQKDFQPVGVTERTYTHEEIQGLFPPPELNKNLNPSPHYRSNKIPYNIRFRGERPSRNGDKKIVGYFKTVMVHKRSLDDQSNGLTDSQSENDKRTLKKRDILDSEFEESRTNPQKINPGASTPTTNATPTRRRRRTTTTASPVTISSTRSEASGPTSRPLNTIRSRYRNALDNKNNDRYGLFTTTQRTSTTTDARRNEPRYSKITRSRGRTTTTTTPAPILPETTASPEVSTSTIEKATAEAEEIYKSEHSVPRSRKVSIGHIEPSGEIYKAIASEFEPEDAEEDDEENENYEEEGTVEDEEDDEEEEEQTTDKPEKIIRKYDVHEDVQEDTTPAPLIGFPKPAVKTSEHVDLSTFLSTDPPGFREAFPEEAIQRANLDRSNNEESYRNAESKDEEVEKDEDEDHTNEKSEDASDEDSTESPRSSESYKDSSSDNVDESENERKNSEQEDGDDKTFFRFESRPQSPFESFEDDKYSGLGPRVNKPAFHHPPFKAPKYERQYFDDSEEEEKDKADESLEKEKYAFPWVHDEEDEKAEAREEYVEQSTEKYEYPWEKRERLAKQRAQRRKDRESLRKLQDFSFLHDDDEDEDDEDERKTASSGNTKEYVYPWDRYDIPTKSKKKSYWKSGRYDNDEMSSEHRPVAKFSSKYNSDKLKLPFLGGEPISVAKPKEIRESVMKFLREEDEKTIEPTVAYETDVLTTAKPDDLQPTTQGPAEEISSTREISSTKEPMTKSKSNNRISNSRIIPENITTAPRKRGRSRVTPVRSKTTTLRPIVKTTTKAVTEVSQISTTSPSTTTKRPSRSRGRSSYKAQESQVATSKVLPPTKSTTTSTTEIPARAASRNTRRGARKRENSTRISNTVNTENVTTKPTSATTTISRRRTRPTTATPATTAKTVSKNYNKSPRRPSRVDVKNKPKETKFDEYNTPVTSPADSVDHDLEDSTPTSRTVEHRSRVSKEEIITKTSFPNEDGTYEMYKDKNTAKSLAARKSKNDHSTDREKSPFDKKTLEIDNPVKKESIEKLSVTTKETPEHFYQTKEVLDKNGHKGMFVSIIPKNQTNGPLALEDELHLRKADLEELERREEGSDSFDEAITKNTESNGDYGRPLTDDSFLLGHVLQKVPPRSEMPEETNGSSEEYEDSEEDASTEREGPYNSYEESDESENRSDQSDEKSNTKAKFEKDPSKRFYYYLEDKK